MTGFPTTRDRKIIPRWRPYIKALNLGELDSTNTQSRNPDFPVDYLSEKISSWRNSRTAFHAADVLGSAIVLGREMEVNIVANYVIQNYSKKWPFGFQLAERALNPTISSSPKDIHMTEFQLNEQRKLVRKYRNYLRIEPKDPITWVDLSFVYVSLGIRKKAEECMNVALHFARENRYVIRSASRLWIHLNDAEKAHHIVVKSRRTKFDPWLLAAEIAIGETANLSPKFTKISSRILAKKAFDANHLSELASAMATLELGAGNNKKARRYFNQSLEQPTENSIAQAVWIDQERAALEVKTELLQKSLSFEAKCQSYIKNSEWNKAIKQCLNWQYDEPYSSIPGVYGSYLAAMALEDYAECKKFAEFSLLANPRNRILLNNLACSQINLGELDEAEKTLSKIKIHNASSLARTTAKATQGLFFFRKGRIIEGQKLYEEAIEDARKLDNRTILSHALTYYALEEIEYFGFTDSPKVEKALKYLKKENDSLSKVLANRLKAAHGNSKVRQN